MPLTLPNLDDRRFDDLVDEARALIPALAPEWTDHNDADPGITLIELFAYLGELLMYRTNRVTAADTRAFVRLLRGPDHQPDPRLSLDDEVTQAVLELRRQERAVTLADHERFALAAAPQAIARVHALARRDLDTLVEGRAAADRGALRDAPGHISLVVVPHAADGSAHPQPNAALLAQVLVELEPRRLLATRLHVAGPRYVHVDVRVALVPYADAIDDRVRADAAAALTRFLDPLHGGADGKGWPFGRPVYVSEIYELLETVPGVDHVRKVRDGATLIDELGVDDNAVDRARLQRNATGELVAVRLDADELVDARIAVASLSIVKE
jgi:hypothetical protein